MRVLMVSPFSTLHNMGGAEVAARRIAGAIARSESVTPTEVIELAALPDGSEAASPVSQLADGTYVMNGGYSDSLRYVSRRDPWSNRTLAAWLVALAPDVVHFHHFLGVGSDLVPLTRRVLPRARIVYTAHELMPLCARDGKMLRSSGLLCEGPSNVECSACVAARPVDIFLRDDHFRRMLSMVDRVVSPSEFVAGRLSSWLRGADVREIPNCPPAVERIPPRLLSDGQGRSRIGFFGQAIPSKGLHALLDACVEAKQGCDHQIEMMVFGTTPDRGYWDSEIAPRLAQLRKGRVRAKYYGPFRNDQVCELMGLVDWVAVPSLWWENAPNVIFESMAAGRPVLVGDVGGMREALAHTGGGLQVTHGSVAHWAQTICEATDPTATGLWEGLADRARPPWDEAEVVRQHMAVYTD